MERFPLCWDGSGQQPNKLRDPKKGRRLTQIERKNKIYIKQGRKRSEKTNSPETAAGRETNSVFRFAFFSFC